MARRLFAIVNPRAGARSGLAMLERVRPRLEAGGWTLAVAETERPGHAVELARGAVKDRGADAIAAVGGDGTLHEVVNGLAALPRDTRLPIAVIPAGSGNSLCADLGTTDPERAVARLVEGASRAIDLCRIDLDGRTLWAINVVGWGAVVRINRRAERMRWAVGARYTLAALIELTRPRLEDADATVDAEPPAAWLFGTASISQHIGKGMRIAPRALLDDGKLDLLRVRRGPRLALARLLRAVYDGGHLASPLVDYRQVERLTLDLGPGGTLLVDGELLSARRARLQVAQSELELLA